MPFHAFVRWALLPIILRSTGKSARPTSLLVGNFGTTICSGSPLFRALCSWQSAATVIAQTVWGQIVPWIS
jgi:hypothetical protein